MCLARVLTQLVVKNHKSQSGHNAVSAVKKSRTRSRNTCRVRNVRSKNTVLWSFLRIALTRADGLRSAHERSSSTSGRSRERLEGPRPNVVGRLPSSRRRTTTFYQPLCFLLVQERVPVTLSTSATVGRRSLHRRFRFVTSWPTRVPCATSNAPLCRFGPFYKSLLDARRADGETEPKASRARREPV